ncbi:MULTISPECIES: YfbU family protein [unclassified Corynebacterium]|uniref:YfbU family protein n=1 Tax=unclassified Corynebacterium TaxID=2624378 RepID=UPI0029CA0FC6|nr:MULTISPECIES: YfbU family protein [unclassified Corynebacterium]WPF65835.1 YfbU family protein [Corynebacterium sp. 22KM0430]WPF68328.1 YfbU family protein [Corynebacterium sp. 21KM1197]
MNPITIRLNKELKDLIAQQAQLAGTTQSDYIRQILEAHVDQTHANQASPAPSPDKTLTLTERTYLALGHQALLAAQGDLPKEKYNAEKVLLHLEALEHGYAGEYGNILAPTEFGLSISECNFVKDILDMFRVIKYSVGNLGNEGWKKINITNAEHYGSFQGFDHQIDLESRMSSYVDFLNKDHRWEEQKIVMEKNHGNSYREMIPTYRSMLAAFKPIWRKLSSQGKRLHLTAEEIQSIIEASINRTYSS